MRGIAAFRGPKVRLGVALALLMPIVAATSALADRRVALVIGNSIYQNSPKLANPENDALAIGTLLKSANFDAVEIRQNLPVAEMRRAIRDFSEATRDADIAVVFYAGHGIEVGGVNYLIPVDAGLRRDVDVEDETVSLDRILSLIEPAKRLRLVILDACRDNPYAARMSRTLTSRSVGRGLARVDPPGSDTLIAYAAKAGSLASDGDGANSPFTAALLRSLTVPGLDIRLALGRVHDDVLNRTGRKQESFVYGALGGATISLVSLTTDTREGGAGATAAPIDADAAAVRDYELAAKVGSREAWEAFLAKHPSGFYADLAKAQRDKVARLTPEGNADVAPPAKAKADPKPAAAKERDKEKSGTQDKGRTGGSNVACCLEYYRRNAMGGNAGNACSPGTQSGNWNLGLRNWCKLVAECKSSGGKC